MKIITKKQQKEIDDLNIKKLMFALQTQPTKGIKSIIRSLAEEIYYADNVMLPCNPSKHNHTIYKRK